MGKESWQCFERNTRSNCVVEVQGGVEGFDRFYYEADKMNENEDFQGLT